MKRVLTALTLAIAIPVFANANLPAEVEQVLPSPVAKGQATATLFATEIYDAELFTSKGAPFSIDQPFALTLVYRYNFSAEILAMASVREMARMEGIKMSNLRPLRDQLKSCFRDVTKGERVTGVGRTPDIIEFYVNGQKTCALKQANLRERFFNIWLGSKTRDPDGAAKLKGQG